MKCDHMAAILSLSFSLSLFLSLTMPRAISLPAPPNYELWTTNIDPDRTSSSSAPSLVDDSDVRRILSGLPFDVLSPDDRFYFPLQYISVPHDTMSDHRAWADFIRGYQEIRGSSPPPFPPFLWSPR